MHVEVEVMVMMSSMPCSNLVSVSFFSFLMQQTSSMRWAERQKNWLSDPATYPLIAILGATGVFVTGFIGYFTVTAPDVQISPLKRYVYICFVSISTVLTAFDTFCLGWLGLAHFEA